MKKIKTLFVLCVMLVVSVLCGTLTACGGGGDDSGKVTITYYMTATSLPKTLSVEKGEEYSMAVLPKLDHYVFQGMYETPDGSGSPIIDKFGNSTIVFTSDMTLYVIWAPLNYTLEFDAGEGTMRDTEKTMEVAYGSTITIMPEAELVGYDFLGWFIDDVCYSSGKRVVEAKQEFTEKNYIVPKKTTDKITLTAKYEIKKLKVYFDYQDYSTPDEITIEYGQTIPFNKFPVKDIKGEKEVSSWSVDKYTAIDFEDPVTEDITLYAIWRYYKIVKLYEDVNGTPTEVRVYQGTPSTAPTPASRTGYEFWGWCTSKTFSNSTPTKDLTYGSSYNALYARWDPITYKVDFETNGGACDTTPIYYTIEDEKALPTPVKDNYTFVGWCKKSDLSDTPMTTLPKGTANVTKLYAKYRGEDRKVVLNAGDGTLSTVSKTVEYGANFTLPVPTYAGYAFTGWYDSPNEGATQITSKTGASINPITTTEKEITVYAHYKQKYFVTVNVNIKLAGSVSVKSYYLEGDEVSLTAEVNDGYSFDGWFIGGSAVGTDSTYEFTMGASNVTIDAKFSANVYTVTFDVGEGTCSSPSKKVTYGEEFTFPVPELSGHRFVYWEYDGEMIADYEGKGCYIWNILTDITVTAYFYEDDGSTTFVYDADTFKSMKNTPSGSYVLVRDVDMSGVSWTPFEFSGTFDGNGFEITNLYIYSSSGNLGVFTKLSGTIKDVTFINLQVNSLSYDHVLVGGICAELTGTITGVTIGCDDDSDESYVSGEGCTIGGLVGKMSSGSLTNSINYADVSASLSTSAKAVGGIVGQFAGGTLSSCKNYGNMTADYTNVGGIIGYATAIDFSNLYNYGDVKGQQIIGGIIGLLEKTGTYSMTGTLVNEGNVGNLDDYFNDMRAPSYAGGIVGKIVNSWNRQYSDNTTYDLRIANWVNKGKVNGEDYVGGVIGYLNAETTGSGTTGSVRVTIVTVDNTGNVQGANYVGGIIGYAHSDNGNSSISNSVNGYYNYDGSTMSPVTVVGKACVGGLAGQLASVRIVSCYNAGTSITATDTIWDSASNTYYAYLGGYVGNGYYVEGCSNNSQIDYTKHGICVGGIAGKLSNGIKNCINDGMVTAENSDNVGGLVGELSYSGSNEIVSLENKALVKGKDNVGGIFGKILNSWNRQYTDGTVYNLKLMQLKNSANVFGTNYVAGCIGYLRAETTGSGTNGSVLVMADTFTNTGDITGITNVGGLFGYGYADNGGSRINYSTNTSEITAEAMVGCIAGKLEGIGIASCTNKDSTLNVTGFIAGSGDSANGGVSRTTYAGGYVGYGYYVEGCTNAVEIYFRSNYQCSYFGGIAGQLTNTIKNCKNTADIDTDTNSLYVGGLVGYMSGTGAYEITNLTNSGKVVGCYYVGGIIGKINNTWTRSYSDNTAFNLQILTLNNSGKVEGRDYLGGVIGEINAKTTGSGTTGSVRVMMSDIRNTGEIVGDDTRNVEALIGMVHTDNSGSRIDYYYCDCLFGGLRTTNEHTGRLVGIGENFTLGTGATN